MIKMKEYIDFKECINKFRKRLGNKVVDDYIDLLESGEYKELVKDIF